jgi:ribosomal 50S subunit-associated protein YjgA (DUF615 family)
MKWFYIIIIIIIYNLFKKNKSVKKQEVTKEQFIPNELFKFVIINTDTNQKFELITLSQLSKKLQTFIHDNLDVIGLPENIVQKKKLKDLIDNNRDLTYIPDNDIIFAIKREDLNNKDITDMERLIAFDKTDMIPQYISNSNSLVKIIEEHPFSSKLYTINNNLLSISMMNNYTLKNNIAPIVKIENDTINNNFINLQEIIIKNIKLYKIFLTNTKSNIGFFKDNL